VTLCLVAAACGGTESAVPTTTEPPATTTTTSTSTTTTLPQEEQDVAAVLAIWEGMNAAWVEGPEAAALYITEHTYPGMPADYEHCLLESRAAGLMEYSPDADTIYPDPDWSPPAADIRVDGRIYGMATVITEGQGAGSEPTLRLLHVTIDEGEAFFFLSCDPPPPPTTTTTTTTTTLPPMAIEGYDGDGVYEVEVVVEADPEALDGKFASKTREMLRAIGIDVTSGAGAVLEVDVTSTAIGRSYQNVGTCYEAARTNGSVTLTLPDGAALTETLRGEVPAPGVTFGCTKEKTEAPHEWSFEQGMMKAIVGLWGPGAVPLLTDIVERDIRDSTYDLPTKAAALDAFRSLDYDEIDVHDMTTFVRATIDLLELLQEEGWTDHGAKRAARRFLTTLSGKDYGSATETDIQQWRDWYDEWFIEFLAERSESG
jgi:hypothetical protein